MNRIWSGLLVGLLVLPALPAQDKPKDGAPRAQYEALMEEFTKKRSELITQLQKTKGEEQRKLIQQYQEVGKSYAEKFFKLAADHPQDPVAVEAVFWIAQNGNGSPVYDKAMAKVKEAIATLPLADLRPRVQNLFDDALLEAVYARVEKEENAPETPDLLAWAANVGGGRTPVGPKALDRLLTKYPDHAAVERVCWILARSQSPQATATLQKLMDSSPKPSIRAAATLALAQMQVAQLERPGSNPAEADQAAAEVEKLYRRVITEFGADAPRHKATAERELKAMNIRPGKEAPEITAPDLDGKEFKLSDYRGKVVLLDFWGHW